MNFLAHLLLTYPHRELTMGNLLGDLVTSKDAKPLSRGLQKGIALHYEIDRYTDTHPEVRKLISLLRSRHAKYAPVVVDILFDYVLARQWNKHADLPYPEFTQWVYDLIPLYLEELPDPIATRVSAMRYHRWLDGYDDIEKLRRVLHRMDQRARFPSQFAAGVEDVLHHYESFSIGFELFYRNIDSRISGMIKAATGINP